MYKRVLGCSAQSENGLSTLLCHMFFLTLIAYIYKIIEDMRRSREADVFAENRLAPLI